MTAFAFTVLLLRLPCSAAVVAYFRVCFLRKGREYSQTRVWLRLRAYEYSITQSSGNRAIHGTCQ